jgi:hypothetical protein
LYLLIDIKDNTKEMNDILKNHFGISQSSMVATKNIPEKHSSNSAPTNVDVLVKLAKLKGVGAITDDEFNQKKQDILGNSGQAKDEKPLNTQDEDKVSHEMMPSLAVMKKEKLSFDDLEQLALLLEKGLITQEEYDAKRDEFYGKKK